MKRRSMQRSRRRSTYGTERRQTQTRGPAFCPGCYAKLSVACCRCGPQRFAPPQLHGIDDAIVDAAESAEARVER